MKSVICSLIAHIAITFKASKYSLNIAQHTQKSKVAILGQKPDP